jgi:hypothetical protein
VRGVTSVWKLMTSVCKLMVCVQVDALAFSSF